MNKRIGSALAMLLCAPMVAGAETVKSGDWSIDHGEGYSEASTFSDGGTRLGYNCNADTKACVFYVNLGSTCEENSKVPGLLNTEGEALAVTFVCVKLGNSYFTVFEQPDEIERIFRSKTRVGVVIPLVDGQFRVARYSLVGASSAIDEARKLKGSSASGDQVI